MSHPDQDPTLHWINEATASMGGAGNAAEVDHPRASDGQPDDQQIVVEFMPDVALEDDGFSAYRGIADELLLELGRTVPLEVRDELARHIGSGIVRSLLRHADSKTDLASITDGVLLEARMDLRNGDLLPLLQETADFIAEARKHASMGPIARWRHQRRLAAEEAKAAKERYHARQDELRRLRHRTYDRGAIKIEQDMQEGDRVEFRLTQGENAMAASTRIRGRVVEYVNNEPLYWGSGRAQRGVVLEIEDEERANPYNFVYDPLPKGARVVVYGTAFPSDNTIRGDHSGQILVGHTPVIGWEGEALKLVSRSHAGSKGAAPRLTLEQLVINEVEMFQEGGSWNNRAY